MYILLLHLLLLLLVLLLLRNTIYIQPGPRKPQVRTGGLLRTCLENPLNSLVAYIYNRLAHMRCSNTSPSP